MEFGNNTITYSTQGMVEDDKWKAVLRDLDEYICEGLSDHAIYGPPPNPRWLELCLKRLRRAYPVVQQNRDLGIFTGKAG